MKNNILKTTHLKDNIRKFVCIAIICIGTRYFHKKHRYVTRRFKYS